MTDPALHDYGNSRAVLIGTSTYQNLGPVPAARSLRRMRELLNSNLCGWPAGKIVVIEDEQGPGDLHYRLIRYFHDVKDVALLYFVGHGFVDDEDELCLGLVGSAQEPHLRASTSLEFRHVREAMIRSQAETKILILDCCNSGRASQRDNTLGSSTELVDKASCGGAYTMAACQPYGTASFETDKAEPQTHFTRYFVDLIETGIPREGAELRLRPIFRQLSEALVAAGHPRPMERNIDSAGEFAFAYNAAPVQVQIDIPTALQQIDVRIARIEACLEALLDRAAGSAPAREDTTGGDPAIDQRAGPDTGTVPREHPGPPNERARLIDGLHTQAADLLRSGSGDEFRSVEVQLQRLNASARPTATLKTSLGTIAIHLLPDFAPETVRNFIELAEGTRPWMDPRQGDPLRRDSRLYDGTLFHRVVRGLLIQGGDPLGTGTGGPGYRQANEFHPELSFDRPYLVAMANSGSSGNGSQFFITVSPAPWLTRKHTIFGLVTDGGDVVDRISEVPTNADDRPIDNVVIETVRISGDLTRHG